MNTRNDSYSVILQCMVYTDGVGDLTNLYNAYELIQKKISPHDITLVIGLKNLSSNPGGPFIGKSRNEYLEALKEYFEKTCMYPELTKNQENRLVIFFEKTLKTLPETTKTLLINKYAETDFVFSISTPFDPPGKNDLKVKSNTVFCNITEHRNTVSRRDKQRCTQLSSNHFVTGFLTEGTAVNEQSKERAKKVGVTSGLMIQDFSLNQDTKIDLFINYDLNLLKKFGFEEKPTIEKTNNFFTSTRIIPIYLHSAPAIAIITYLLTKSKWVQELKINHLIFIAPIDYEDKLTELLKSIPLTDLENDIKISVITHRFQNSKEYKAFMQVLPEPTVFVTSGDKSLEEAISIGLFPIYVAPAHKSISEYDIAAISAHSAALHDYLTAAQRMDLEAWFSDLSCQNPVFAERAINEIKNIANKLTTEAISQWNQEIRPLLLKENFFDHFDREFIDPILHSKNRNLNSDSTTNTNTGFHPTEFFSTFFSTATGTISTQSSTNTDTIENQKNNNKKI